MYKKKIFFLVGSFKLGGTEKVAKQIGERLIGNDFDVRFVSLLPERNFTIEPERDFVLLKARPKRRFTGFWNAYWSLSRLIRKESPDYVVAFSVGMDLFLFIQFFRRTVFVIDTNMFCFVRKWYYKYLLRIEITFPHVRKVVVPSEGLTNACAKFFWGDQKLVTIGNPVNLHEVNIARNEPLDEDSLENSRFIVTAGRLVRTKGFDTLIRAYANSSVRKDYLLVILGVGSLEGELRMLVKDLGLEERVLFLGYKDNPYKYFFRAKLFVLNTRMESFGNVLIEALACGTPVLCSDIDFGPREIVQKHVNGDLFSWNNQNEIGDVIERIVGDEQIYDSFRMNATKSVTRFDIEIILPSWQSLFDN